MVSLSTRPVVHHLKLLFALRQWAIAACRIQTITKGIGAAIVVTQLTVHPAVVAVVGEQEPGEPAGDRRPGNPRSRVESREAEFVHGRLRSVGVRRLRVVLEIAEANVSKPLGTDRFSDTERQAVIVYVGTTVQPARPKPF